MNGKGLWVTMGGTRERDKGGVMLEGGCWEVGKDTLDSQVGLDVASYELWCRLARGHAACCGVVENGSWGQGLALSLKINGEDRKECGWVGGKGERQTPVGSWRDLCARAPVFTHFQGCSLYKSRPAHPILLYPGSLFFLQVSKWGNLSMNIR